MFKLNLAVADNYINGQFVPPKSGNYLDIISPHDSAVIGKVALSNHEDISNAVEMAKKAFEKWSYCTVKERVKYLLHLRHIIEENENELAEIIMKEHGKNKSEALAEIRKGNETVEYACSMPQLICGKVLEVSNGVECKEYRMPHGVVASIVPFNFPMMVPMWTMPIAIALGNCFILKPSEKVPLTMNKFCDYVKKAGFPDGVFQIINGTSDAVLGLCDHPDIKAISFVGSSKVANIVSNRCSIQNPPKKVLALGGAKNHLVAVPDCDIDMTSTDVVNSFCGCSGQRCMAASVLLLIGEQKELIDSICKKASELQIGNGPRDLGPLIDKNAVQRVHDYINLAEKDGHKILVDGRSWTNKFEKGNWIGPTVILFNNSSHNAMKDEIFGPLLSIYVCKDNHEAIKIENDNPYGNAGCVYTSTGEQAEWFTKRFSAGMIGINIGVPVPREPFAFGGINNSKFGSYDITADGGTEFWTWRKKVTTKWVPPKKKTWMD